MRLSFIVPTLNEEESIGAVLDDLQGHRQAGHEVVVVDGGSTDGTTGLARPAADRLLTTAPGRARQMNAGAATAAGEALVFLHADTRLPTTAAQDITGAFDRGADWGRFDLRLSGRAPALRVIERMINLRSRIEGLATGDQCMFVLRRRFEELGGYPEIALMEDVALSRSLRRVSRPACLESRVTTSSRRWERDGILRTVLLMWSLRLRYALGDSPERLARLYYR